MRLSLTAVAAFAAMSTGLAACTPVSGPLASAPASPEAPAAPSAGAAPSPDAAAPSPGTGAGTADPTTAAGPSSTTPATPSSTATAGATTGGPTVGSHAEQLALIRASSPRNATADGWEFRDARQDEIPDDAYLGPRSEYAGVEGAFPAPRIGGFRLDCEFSHFAYDDPIVHPGKPGAAHLHMFFGNTDVTAFTTADSLRDSGSSTCNGFVRNGYWAPALFDAQGDVQVPEFVRVYYKGFYDAVGSIEGYPERMAMVSDDSVNATEDGANSFTCIDSYGGNRHGAGDSMPDCVGRTNPDQGRNMLEVNVKFPNCWNGQDPTDYAANLVSAQFSWFSGICPESHPRALPNLEFLMRYTVPEGQSTAGWYLSSDVDPMTFQVRPDRGGSNHADWWGAWDPDIEQQWLDNCVNVPGADCGTGFLDNGGNGGDGPTLKRRAEYEGPMEVPAVDLFQQLCPVDRTVTRPEEAAYCDLAPMMATMGH